MVSEVSEDIFKLCSQMGSCKEIGGQIAEMSEADRADLLSVVNLTADATNEELLIAFTEVQCQGNPTIMLAEKLQCFFEEVDTDIQTILALDAGEQNEETSNKKLELCLSYVAAKKWWKSYTEELTSGSEIFQDLVDTLQVVLGKYDEFLAAASFTE